MNDQDGPWPPLTAKDIRQIMEMIPHRYPFLMIDKIREIVKAEYAIGVKNVSMNEWFFEGHFPGIR